MPAGSGEGLPHDDVECVATRVAVPAACATDGVSAMVPPLTTTVATTTRILADCLTVVPLGLDDGAAHCRVGRTPVNGLECASPHRLRAVCRSPLPAPPKR